MNRDNSSDIVFEDEMMDGVGDTLSGLKLKDLQQRISKSPTPKVAHDRISKTMSVNTTATTDSETIIISSYEHQQDSPYHNAHVVNRQDSGNSDTDQQSIVQPKINAPEVVYKAKDINQSQTNIATHSASKLAIMTLPVPAGAQSESEPPSPLNPAEYDIFGNDKKDQPSNSSKDRKDSIAAPSIFPLNGLKRWASKLSSAKTSSNSGSGKSLATVGLGGSSSIMKSNASLTSERSKAQRTFMTSSFGRAVDTDSLQDLRQQEDLFIDLILCTSNQSSEASAQRTKLQGKQIEHIERTMVTLLESDQKIELKTHRAKNLRTYRDCCTGEELINWLMTHCDFMEKFEAIQYATMMFCMGYLIDLDNEKSPFSESALYIFQSQRLWMSNDWMPSDVDYAVYLYRRANKKIDVGRLSALESKETERLDYYRKYMTQTWKDVEDSTFKQLVFLKQLNVSTRKILQLREQKFWWIHRRHKSQKNPYLDIEESGDSDKQHLTDAEYEATLNKRQLLDHLMKRLATYQIQYETSRLKVSVESRALIDRCQVWQFRDPFIKQTVVNPYNQPPSKEYGYQGFQQFTLEDAEIWYSSFKDLMDDKRGRVIFMKFLEKEFSTESLKFMVEVQELDNVFDRIIWVRKALEIYSQYVKPGCQQPVNISDSTKQQLISAFDPLFEDVDEIEGSEVDVYVFTDAVADVQKLLMRDSYARFVASDFCKEYSSQK
ncbi:hypothetical protein MP228_000317 [Amoeboaphelidium protococcarum]|nr:hypothetical protein MP228_000317 [Amoeboaphelidium protococcarum]